MKYILEEIKKTDSFYSLFKKEFSELIFEILQEFHPDTEPNEDIENLLHSYAVAILNATESVIDKDRNYPFYRLEEELGTMKRITSKYTQTIEQHAFKEAILLNTKSLMVKYFPKIFDLSSTGFRLLEQNVKLYNWEFISNFETISTSSSSRL
jgi:hypothetical protein